ncbi:NAD(P)H-binding protein [Treponema sp. OMZ 840]|uniref:NAD(P)-dependent oxidoreductase n=1 Tax=Treponema sp. OMZ 840 TaxID=244313 RepID=UPI003D8ED905
MKKRIAIIGANGKQGSCLTDEAVERGHEVTGIVRHDYLKNPKAKLLQKDLFDLTADDLKSFDLVISAFGAWTAETIPQHISSLRHLCDCLKGTGIRLLIVGGAGCLYTDSSHTLMLADSPDLPEEFKLLAQTEVRAFSELKQRTDVLWTYLCPPADFRFDAPKTGKYKIGGIELPVNSAGASFISYKDFAAALIDEAEKGNFVQKHFSVVSG